MGFLTGFSSEKIIGLKAGKMAWSWDAACSTRRLAAKRREDELKKENK